MTHVAFEGLPGAGVKEVLTLLSHFFPEQIVLFPNLVEQIALPSKSDQARRKQLTKAIISELPRRRAEIAAALAQGKLCLQESHLGVHLAYAMAVDDRSFIQAYPKIRPFLPKPDCYLRLGVPLAASSMQERNHPAFAIAADPDLLKRVMAYLDAWHVENQDQVIDIQADGSASSVISRIEKILGLRYGSHGIVPAGAFRILFLLGRPASGKSEFIDFMERCPLDRRLERYHLALLSVFDDFPLLWEKFEEDNVWELVRGHRLHSKRANGNYTVLDDSIWPFLTKRINAQLENAMAEDPLFARNTAIVEFSRGSDHGYAEALRCFSSEVLSCAAILYVHVSPEESQRRNVARYNAEKKQSILSHTVPHEEMERIYSNDDWSELAPHAQGVLDINGIPVPYITMNNEPELTDPVAIGKRYHAALGSLYSQWRNHAS